MIATFTTTTTLLLHVLLLQQPLVPSTQASISIGGLNAHCIDTKQCDSNMARTKQVLGKAAGVSNKGQGKKKGQDGKGKGKGKKKGK